MEAELSYLLDIIEKHLPILPEKQQIIANIHCGGWLEKSRNREASKRKYQTFTQLKMLTEALRCSSDVRRAKEIYHQVIQNVDLFDKEDREDGRVR